MPKDAERGKTGGTPFRKEKSEMDTIFQSLQQTTGRLNATADAANELIRTTSERLERLGAGVSFASSECVLRTENLSRYNEDADREEDAGYDSCVLSYTKIHGVWQLGVQQQHYVPARSGLSGCYDLVGSEEEPLLNADRELRIKAASMLPDFLQEYTVHLSTLADELPD